MTICTICNSSKHHASSCDKRSISGESRRVDWEAFDAAKKAAEIPPAEQVAAEVQWGGDITNWELDLLLTAVGDVS